MDGLSSAVLDELAALCPGGIALDVDLAAISQWRIGGRADIVLSPASTAEVASLRRWFAARGVTPVVIGLTSNLLFADEGLRVPVLQIGPRMADIVLTPQHVLAQAGIWVPGLARRLMQAGLTGAEHICGIPGTLGGLICMNGGSQRKGIGSSVVEVQSIDTGGNLVTRCADECNFAYRHSVYQINGEVITSAKLHFATAPHSTVRAEMRKILADRRRKFPRKLPNCGSVFKSNPAMYAEIGPPGAAIERLGFKGQCEGAAQVSLLHANFIVNNGGARAKDVLRLIDRITTMVECATGYRMETEVCYVSPTGRIAPADQLGEPTT